jgi:hypothetical protein
MDNSSIVKQSGRISPFGEASVLLFPGVVTDEQPFLKWLRHQ